MGRMTGCCQKTQAWRISYRQPHKISHGDSFLARQIEPAAMCPTPRKRPLPSRSWEADRSSESYTMLCSVCGRGHCHVQVPRQAAGQNFWWSGTWAINSENATEQRAQAATTHENQQLHVSPWGFKAGLNYQRQPTGWWPAFSKYPKNTSVEDTYAGNQKENKRAWY